MFDLFGIKADGTVEQLTETQTIISAQVAADGSALAVAHTLLPDDLVMSEGQPVDASAQIFNLTRVAEYDVTSSTLNVGDVVPGLSDVATAPDRESVALAAAQSALSTAYAPSNVTQPNFQIQIAPASSVDNRAAVASTATEQVRSLGWSPDGDRIAYLGQSAVYVLDVGTQQVSEVYQARAVDGPDGRGSISGFAWSPDGKSLLVKEATVPYFDEKSPAVTVDYAIEIDLETGESVDYEGVPGLEVTYASSDGNSIAFIAKTDPTNDSPGFTIEYWERDQSGTFTPTSSTPLGDIRANDLQIPSCALPA